MILLQLFFEFFKTGLFSIGGGLATLPFLQDMAERTNWFTSSELLDLIAIAQSTPGPIGVNMATGIGYETAGVLGAITAITGLVFPSIVIIIVIAHFLNKFRKNKIVEWAFYGLRPTSTALIAAAGYSIVKISLFTLEKFKISKSLVDLISIKGLILSIILFYFIHKFNKHPVVYIAASAIIGVLFKFSI